MVAHPASRAQLRVACLGNSITYGTALPDPQTQCYPAVLQQLLGDGYKVENFGHAGAAVLIRGHHPYTQTQEYAAALAFRPDIAVIHLGVNDTIHGRGPISMKILRPTICTSLPSCVW